MRRILLIVAGCSCLLSCKVTKRAGGDISWRSDGSVATQAATATAPDEFPTTSSPTPTPDEWQHALALTPDGWEAPCTASRVREWLRVVCQAKGRPIDGVQLIHSRGSFADVTTVDTAELASVVLPVRRGGDIQLAFLLPDGSRELWALWSLGARTPSITFKKELSPHDKLRCTAPTKSGPCCYRAFSGTSFHPELQCDRTRYQEICISNADCDSRTNRVCRPGPPGTNLKLCASP